MTIRYAFYPGCIIQGRFPHLENSARMVTKHLGIQLENMENTTCCPEPFSIQSIDRLTHLSIAARNISVAEEIDLNIMVLCNGCLSTLSRVNTILKTDYKLRNSVNLVLGETNHKYKGEVEVKHLYQVLIEDIGTEKIKEHVVNPLKDVKVAVHYGCHLLDPAFMTKLDEVNQPRGFEKLVEATGVESVTYEKQYTCCGGPMRDINDKISREALIEKLEAVTAAGADFLAVLCPLCYTQYDLGQSLEQRKTGKEYNIPVLYYHELLALAMGYSGKQIGLFEHSITKGFEKFAT